MLPKELINLSMNKLAQKISPYSYSFYSKTTAQVWSLTQFYSVDFSKSRIGVKSAFSTNAQSRFASVVVDGVLGPPRLAGHT